MTMPYEDIRPQYEYIPSGDSYATKRGAAILEEVKAYYDFLRQPQAELETVEKPKTITDHAAAAAEVLEKIVAQLRAGRPPEELGPNVILVGRMMARRT